MQLDERGTLAVVSHPGHEFLGIGARIGGELVAGVPQVVKVKASRPTAVRAGSQTRRRKLECASRDPVELAKTNRPRREPVQVRARVGNDQLGEVQDADTGPGLGRPERVTGPVVIELVSHPHGAGVQVDRRPQSAEVSPRHRDWPRRLRRASYDS